MDSFAFRLANALVGNDADAAGLEITLSGATYLAQHDAQLYTQRDAQRGAQHDAQRGAQHDAQHDAQQTQHGAQDGAQHTQHDAQRDELTVMTVSRVRLRGTLAAATAVLGCFTQKQLVLTS